MKEKRSIYGFILLAFLAFLLTPSCTKEDKTGTLSETIIKSAQDEAYTDAVYTSVDNMAVSEITSLENIAYSNPLTTKAAKCDDDYFSCRTVTVDHPDSSSFPKVITVDYGDSCTYVFRDDTITLSGKMIITLTDHWFKKDAQLMVTFDNFYFNDNKIEGTRTITNMGLNEKLHFKLGIKLQGGKVTFADGSYMTREADHVREWAYHPGFYNDTLFITGTASGINALGQNYSRVITSPLVLVHCQEYVHQWVIVGGTVDVTNSATGTTTIDYSAEGCDGTVLIRKDGNLIDYAFKYYGSYNRGHGHHRGHNH
jgi:hypothetical protein